MRLRLRRAAHCAAAVGMAVAAVACGGSSDEPAVDTEVEAELVVQIAGAVLADAEMIGPVEALAGDVGEDLVFEAVALALDRGYSVGQLSEAAGAGTVAVDGVIVGADPDGDPFGFLVASEMEAQSFGRAADLPVTPGDLADAVSPVHPDFDWRVDLDDDAVDNVVLAGVLMTLVEMGYSFDQVVEGVVFGELSVRYATDRKSYSTGSELVALGCLSLADGTGSVVVPERSPARGTSSRAFQCGQAAKNGLLLTADEAADALRADRGDAITADSAPDAGAETAEGEEPAAEAGIGYQLTAVLDSSEESGSVRYDWNGTFRLDDVGVVEGTGTVTGSASGTCESPGYEGTVEGPYAFSVEGTYSIAGRATGDQLELSMTDPSATFTAQEGDRSILCVDISADVALAFAQLPLGAAELELGSIVIPTGGGSTVLDFGEGLIIEVEVVPT